MHPQAGRDSRIMDLYPGDADLHYQPPPFRMYVWRIGQQQEKPLQHPHPPVSLRERQTKSTPCTCRPRQDAPKLDDGLRQVVPCLALYFQSSGGISADRIQRMLLLRGAAECSHPKPWPLVVILINTSA